MLHHLFSSEENALPVRSFLADNEATHTGKIHFLHSDFSYGPIQDIHLEQGIGERKKWFDTLRNSFPNIAPSHGFSDDLHKMETLIEHIAAHPEDRLRLWISDNAKDLCMYYWLLHYIEKILPQTEIINLHSLPFLDTESRLFYPQSIQEIPSKEIKKTAGLVTKISPQEFISDKNEWQKICFAATFLRVRNGWKYILHEKENHHDTQILKGISKDFMNFAKVISQVKQSTRNIVDNWFFIFRLPTFLQTGKILFKESGQTINLRKTIQKQPILP